jgi:hypothetical protein
MSDLGDRDFATGQPVWVVGRDGSKRPAEYVGKGGSADDLGGLPKVFVIYVDAPGGEVVEADQVVARAAPPRMIPDRAASPPAGRR